MRYEISIEEKAKLYAERVCNGNFPIEYSKEQVAKHTANDFMAGFKCANPIGFSRILYYGTWQTIGDNGRICYIKAIKQEKKSLPPNYIICFLIILSKNSR